MPDSPPDGPLPDDTAVPTDEASPDHAAIASYFDALPQQPIMTAGPED